MFCNSLKGLFFMWLFIADLSLGKARPFKGNDPYLWLEETEGEKTLSWVNEANKQSLSIFSKTKKFLNLKNKIFENLSSKNKIPKGQFFEGYVYNFWQDETNKRGIWRRATLENYF